MHHSGLRVPQRFTETMETLVNFKRDILCAYSVSSVYSVVNIQALGSF